MNKLVIIGFVFFSCVSHLSAQISTSSPYSRFGLGELQKNILPEFSALGGASTALSSSKSINFSNPASYTSFNPNSFLFSTGGWHKVVKLETIDAEQISNNTAFSHLVLGFRLSKRVGASFGLVPFSSTGYEMSSNLTNENNSNVEAVANYFGNGGISKFYFGGAYQATESLSIGLNTSYLFGGLNRSKMLIYNDESFLNSRSNSKINLKGYYYELGILFNKQINKNDKILIGLTANNNSKIRAKKTELVESFEFSGLFESPKDTFVNSVTWGNIILPRYTSFGLSYNQNEKWLYAFSYSTQNWAEYTMFDEYDNLANSTRISFGMQFTPEFNSITKYYKRMDFRAGVSYNNTPLQFENNQLKDISISFGLGIPVKKSRTKYDFTCTLSKRGTTDKNLIEEKYIILGLSIAYDGVWFVKRKYD